jgi:hypothetical protein
VTSDSHAGQWKYFYRVVRPDFIAPYIKLRDGDEIRFGLGIGGVSAAEPIPNPSPAICNLHLAIARVSFASGASEVFDQFVDDEDDNKCQVPVYFGGPFVPDDVLIISCVSLRCWFAEASEM